MRVLIGLLLYVITITVNAQWTALNGPSGGDITDLEVNGSTLYVVVAQRVFKSDNEGASWSEIVPQSPASFQVADLLIDGNVLYAVNYNVLYKSEDNGQNWSKVNRNDASGQFFGASNIIRVSENTFAAYGNGVSVSDDDGQTWTRISNAWTYDAMATSEGDLFVADIEGVRRHLHPSGTEVWAPEAFTTVYARANDEALRLGYKSATERIFLATRLDILSSSNNGDNWQSIEADLPDNFEDNFFASRWGVSPDGKLYFSSHRIAATFVSDNDGLTWNQTPLPWPSANYGNAPLYKLIFLSNTKLIASTGYDGVFKSIDGGTTWSPSSSGINFPNGAKVVLHGSRLLLHIGFSKGYWFSDNNGTSWTYKQMDTFSNGIFKDVSGNLILYDNGAAIRYSVNGGNDWTVTNDVFDFFCNSATLTYGAYNNRIASSSGNGTWTNLTITGLPADYRALHIAVDEADNLFVQVRDNATNEFAIYKITAGTAVKLEPPLSSGGSTETVNYLTGLFVSDNKLYFSTGQQIYIASDAGTTWSKVGFGNNAFLKVAGGICASTAGVLY
ncbi:MAG TPA: hypothetical protein VGD65_03515, partial [Chryseosolibacter sp.]